jgi:flagellar FliJ protein
MKKFVFRLESLLRLRRHREELEEVRLGDLMRERQECEEAKEQLQNRLVQTLQQMTARTETTSGELNLYRNYALSLESKLLDLGLSLRKLQAQIEVQRSVLVKVRRHRKVVDRLKDKRRERHQYEQDRKDQAELEELHLLRRGQN